MTSRPEQLAKKLRKQRRLAFATLGGLTAIVLAVTVWVIAMPLVAEREAFRAIQDDFQDTWCATYGVDPTDPGLDLWEEFAERNRSYMEENYGEFAVIQTDLDGSRTFDLYVDMAVREYRLGYWELKDFWFSTWLSSFFYVFEFEGGYGSPPSC